MQLYSLAAPRAVLLIPLLLLFGDCKGKSPDPTIRTTEEDKYAQEDVTTRTNHHGKGHHHHVQHYRSTGKEPSPIIGSSSNGGGKDVIDKVLFADRLSPDVKHREKARKEQDEKAAAAGRSKHLLLKFQDLPVWESNLSTFQRVKRGKPRENLKPSSIILDMRRYNPLTAHLLAQSYVYPDSNGLSQTDREYFEMIRSESGLSDVHFEKSAVAASEQPPNGGQQQSNHEAPGHRIKGLANTGRQLVTKSGSQEDCSRHLCNNPDKKDTSSPPSSSTSTVVSEAKTLPRFAYHRVPGSFAAFRVISPAFTIPSYDSYHDDEPPQQQQQEAKADTNLDRPQRDVAAVQLVADPKQHYISLTK